MRNWETPRGFTLLELLITVIVMGVLLSTALPNFHHLSVNNQMLRAASEFAGFLRQARSEAIWRNRDLWIHITSSSHPAVKDWTLTLTDSDQVGLGERILLLHGGAFKDLKLDWTYSANRIKFDGARGRAKTGSLSFYPQAQPTKALRLKSSFAGNRIMICGVNGSDYGFPAC
ncbi:pilus assembly protein FimT [Vibrio galatheae]|uniref:Type II secretion system protein H n=1 Tax=Vibrio galatheae TaxID=579748 RepID=A0A0F4NR52_9VIBR|nr:GspH/FimT family pseudopilin [Vibrio galatheae]KJY85338.1 pilus assembly protein FimT [Vibrio galatheae]